jgi:hypothetical protein
MLKRIKALKCDFLSQKQNIFNPKICVPKLIIKDFI